MSEVKIVVRFAGDSKQANLDAASFQRDFREIRTLEVQTINERPGTQDFGATVVLILGTTSVTALAHGLANWLTRNAGAKLSITMTDGTTVSGTGLQSKDVSKIVSALSSHVKSNPRPRRQSKK
jgi:hypothetical protein